MIYEAKGRINFKIFQEIFWLLSVLFFQAVRGCSINNLGEEITLPVAKLGHVKVD